MRVLLGSRIRVGLFHILWGGIVLIVLVNLCVEALVASILKGKKQALVRIRRIKGQVATLEQVPIARWCSGSLQPFAGP